MEKTIIFKTKGNEYNISFPSVGTFRDIQTNKQLLSNGTYKTLCSTPTKEAQLAADMVDIEATLISLCPSILEDLKCNSFSELDILDFKELKNSYADQIIPWWNSITEALSLD